MAGTAHLQGLTRWPGKPTSGRYVYQGLDGTFWFWQCDLCGAYGGELGGGFHRSMQSAFRDCLIHASECIDRPVRYEEN